MKKKLYRQQEETHSQFAHFNDDVLFGENWNNQDLSDIILDRQSSEWYSLMMPDNFAIRRFLFRVPAVLPETLHNWQSEVCCHLYEAG